VQDFEYVKQMKLDPCGRMYCVVFVVQTAHFGYCVRNSLEIRLEQVPRLP